MAPFLKQERPPFRENYPFPLAGIFVGRVAERKLLSEWLCLKGNYGRLPILVLHGIGGAGKSSLAWLWANRDVAGIELPLPDDPKEVAKQCAIDRGWRIGLSVLWFSFYREEGGETFPRFLETAIEHFSGGRRLPSNYLVDGKKDYYEMERDLRDILNTQKCLLIWDGAERLLWEYFDSDAVLKDSLRPVPQEYTVRSRNFVNPQVARFVWGFTRQIHSKLLILSRVSIADLENYPAEQIPLKGLEPEAAVEFLKKRGVRGPESLLRKRAEDYAFHPLSLSNLAAAVIEDYNTFGHIGDAPSFDPGIPMNRRRRHVLKVAFQKRSSQLRQLLSRLAAARGVIRGEVFEHLSEDIKGLDKSNIGRSLGELLRHGLLRRWDANNAFDMHPLVRGYAYVRLSGKQKIHQKLSDYYRLSRQTLKLDDPIDIGWVESAIEFFYHTARAGRYMDALYFFKTDYDKRARNLNSVLFDELGDYFDFIGLLTELFPDGLDSQPAVDEWWKAMVLNDLALAYLNIGDPQRAERLLKRGVNFARELRRRYGSHPQDLLGASRQIALCLESLAEARSSLGKLRKAFENIMDSAALCLVFDLDQGVIFVARVLGSLFSLLGRHQEFESLIGPVRNTVSVENPTEYFYDLAFAEDFLMRGDTPSAALHLKTAKQRLQGLTDRNPFPRFRVRLECLEGEVALASGELQPAEGHFSSVLRDGRRLGLVELELRALLGLAGVRGYPKNNI